MSGSLLEKRLKYKSLLIVMRIKGNDKPLKRVFILHLNEEVVKNGAG
jgi:hypothetical protein